MHHVGLRLSFAADGISGEAICGPADPVNDVSYTQGSVLDSFVIGNPSPLGVGGGPVETVPLRATLSPSPLRSQSRLTFFTTRPGPLHVALYDIKGRRVRDLLDQVDAPAGLHQVLVEASSDRGEPLRSGVYFFRIRAEEGASSGRFVVAR